MLSTLVPLKTRKQEAGLERSALWKGNTGCDGEMGPEQDQDAVRRCCCNKKKLTRAGGLNVHTHIHHPQPPPKKPSQHWWCEKDQVIRLRS